MVELQTIKLPEGFLEDETRNQYFVSRNRKEVWAIELDLFAKLIEVCKKYNITYFADSGTLLGAARHKGFIPWDDDIDVAMLRNDYDRFCEIAEMEFEFPYFFQTEKTDPGSARKHAQIRNSLTTGILKEELPYNYSFNQGIFIDVFPLDNLPSVADRYAFFEEIKYLREKSNWFTDEHTHQGDLCENTYYIEFEKCLKRYNNLNSLQIGNLALMGGKRSSNRYKADYMGTTELTFEFLKICAPIGYKNELRRMFGIWKEPKKYNAIHNAILFDVSTPYTEYLGNSNL